MEVSYETSRKTQAAPAKRVVFTMGGKGGVGKTGVMVHARDGRDSPLKYTR